jgi:hypothetical protein
MGVPIVLHHVANQPHTPPHFSSFPNELPDYLFTVLFLDCTFAVSCTLHFIHNQFAHLQISLHFTYLIQKPIHGAPTLHQFSEKIVPYPGQPYHIGAPVSIFVHLSQNYFLFIVQTPLFPVVTLPFCRHLWRPSSLFWPMQPMSPLVGELLTLDDIIHIFRVPHRPLTSAL